MARAGRRRRVLPTPTPRGSGATPAGERTFVLASRGRGILGTDIL
jgi:hypothetical protein